jgi:hypothetical protein
VASGPKTALIRVIGSCFRMHIRGYDVLPRLATVRTVTDNGLVSEAFEQPAEIGYL